MHYRSKPETSPFSLALYGAAIAVALGAAAIASTSALVPGPASEPLLVVGSNLVQPAHPERVAGLIAPAVPIITSVSAEPASIAAPTPQIHPATVPAAPARLAAIPPKPVPRPCLDCAARARPAAAVAMAPAAEPVDATVADSFDVASISVANDGPVPPLPVGDTAGEGARTGLLMRGGQAVVSGSSQLVGSAWTLSGEAVGGIVRGVRDLTF